MANHHKRYAVEADDLGRWPDDWDVRDEFGRRLCSGDAKWVDPNRRDEKSTHPYSYSEFFHFGDRRIIHAPGVRGEYSDRIWGWDYDKAEALWKEHVRTRWDLAGPEKLSAFLSAFHGRKVRVVALAEGCNASNGYPYFIVWYVDADERNAKP